MRNWLKLLGIMLIISCNKPTPHINEITKIELARSGAWADHGAIISIDSSLDYKYYGKYDNAEKGNFEGKVSEGFWDTLNEKFNKINYKQLRLANNLNGSDINIFELIINWKNGKRRIMRSDDGHADSALKIILWLNNSYKSVNLQQVNTPFKFEVSLPELPPVKLARFK